MSTPRPPDDRQEPDDRREPADWSDAHAEGPPAPGAGDGPQGGTPRCAECGADLAEDQTYCLECGHPTPRAPRLARRGRYGLAIAAGLVVLGLGAGALAYAVAQDDDAKAVTAGSTITEVTATGPVSDPSTEFTVPTDIATGGLPPATDGFPTAPVEPGPDTQPSTDDFPIVTEQPGPDTPTDAPADPVDPVEPVEPIDPVEPVEPVDPGDPGDPGGDVSDWPAGTTAWTAIVSSVRDEGEARATADRLAGSGEDAGVLFSSDHPGLRPGYWVVFSGSFPSRAGAAGHARALAGAHPGAYPRLIEG